MFSSIFRPRSAGIPRLLGFWLLLAASSSLSAQAIVRDYLRVSVKYILGDNGARPPGVYGTETSIETAFSDMNIILDRLGIRWRLLLVDVHNVGGASEFYAMEDGEMAVLERKARDESPGQFRWRNDAINIYVVSQIEGAGGVSSFPGDTNHHDVITIASDLGEGEISGFSAGWLHEIGHYLSLKHTFQCSVAGCTSDKNVCQGEGAVHRGWNMKCPDVCPHNLNIMSYDDIGVWGGDATRTGTFTACQIENMDFEIYDPRGERHNVLQPCSQSCAELARPCRNASDDVYAACANSCDVVQSICLGGCSTVGQSCYAVCQATGDTCRAGCTVAVETCYAGCEVPCFFDSDSGDCRECRRECSNLRADCESPCNEAQADCDKGCPSPSQCEQVCLDQLTSCRAACEDSRRQSRAICDGIEAECNRNCPAPPPSPANLAQRAGVTVSQSSDYDVFYQASQAIDGNLETFSHTRAAADQRASWRINLGAEFEIETVVLYNRRDCCQSRLRDIRLSIRDAQDNVLVVTGAMNANNYEGHQTLRGPPRLIFHLPFQRGAKVRGQIIQVERDPDIDLSGSGSQGNADEAYVLALAEVAIYGTIAPPAPDVNLLRGLDDYIHPSVRQSTTGFEGLASRAVDGNRNGSFFAGSVTHTAEGDPAPWWEVDLGQSFPIGKIAVWNRTDCCAARLHNFRVKLLNDLGAVTHSSDHFTDGSYPDSSGGLPYEIQGFGNDARTIRIEHMGDINGSGLALSLAEVEVFTGSRGSRFVRGDTDSSGTIDLADGIVTLGYLFTGGKVPACLDAADVDDDGQLTIGDAISTFSWLFSGGRAPQPPTPTAAAYSAAECGDDLTRDVDLDCAQPSAKCGG